MAPRGLRVLCVLTLFATQSVLKFGHKLNSIKTGPLILWMKPDIMERVSGWATANSGILGPTGMCFLLLRVLSASGCI